ncbi:MAG: D-aminoacyl-tRNA deacylase [Thermoproteota archaeon]
MPPVIFVVSKKDVAGQNSLSALRTILGFRDSSDLKRFYVSGKECMLIEVDVDIVHVGRMVEKFCPSLVIHLSRHSSESKIPTLSVHVSGNISSADLGGEPGKISIAPASAMLAVLKELKKQRDFLCLDFDVCYEATHHGPSLDVPSIFIEIGSDLEKWRQEKAGYALAHASLAAVKAEPTASAAIGLGGTHYCPKFTQLALEESQPIGHILPKYSLEYVDGSFLRYALTRSVEPIDKVILDWKGISGNDKARLIPELEKLGLPIERV